MAAHDQSSRQPIYQRIADDLRAAIMSVEYGPGDKLPSEHELAGEYNVQRTTVRAALRLLVNEGLVESRPKRGNYVRRSKIMLWNMSERDSIAASAAAVTDPWVHAVTSAGYNGRQTIVVQTASPAKVILGRNLGDLLDLDGPTKLALCRSRLRLVDDVPTELADSYYPFDLVKDTSLVDPADIQPGIFPILEKMGHVRTQFRDLLHPRMPTPLESDRLEIPPATPVTELVRRSYFTPDNKCLLVRHSIYGDGCHFGYTIDA